MKRVAAHFSLERWAEFVQSRVAEPDWGVMERHLAVGCQACQETIKWVQAIANSARNDAAIEVPTDLVTSVRSLFAPAPVGSRWTDALREISGVIVRQMTADWQPVGVRSLASEENRVLLRAGAYAVDLNIEPTSRESAEIVGQIVNEKAPQLLDQVLVQIIAAGKTLCETSTNRFGEFIITFPQGKNSILRLAMRDQGERIDVPLTKTRRRQPLGE